MGGRSSVFFTMSAVDEVDLVASCLRHVRRVYPDSRVALLVDTRNPALRARWRDIVPQDPATTIYECDEPLYSVEGGGAVVSALLSPFLASQEAFWMKIDPDTYVRRPVENLPTDPCFFGTLQGGALLPSLQGGCIGGTREAATALEASGALRSPELVEYATSWASDNPRLLRRAGEQRLVSFDFVHAWASRHAGIPLIDHPEIRSHWLRPPGNGSQYAITHPHKDLAAAHPRTKDEPAALADAVRTLVRATTPEGATVAVVSHGDDELVHLDGRQGWHFPRHPDGYYLGEHPADSGRAIALLERLRGEGATYLLIPEPSLWWLDHYLGFRHHLEEGHALLVQQDGIGVIYDLRADPPANINTAGYWDSIYREEFEHGEAAEAEYKRDYGLIHTAITTLVPSAARVLDIGCGPGLLCRRIKHQHPDASVTGVDLSDYVVEHNDERDAGLGIEYRSVDAQRDLPTLDAGYDVVTLCEVIEHLDEPERVVADAIGLLRPGGRFILTCPHDDAIVHPEHVRQWGHDEIFHLLEPYAQEVRFRRFSGDHARWLLAYVDALVP